MVNGDDIGYIIAMPRSPTLTVKKLIAMPPALAEAIEEYRFRERIKTEAEAIRRLIEAGLSTRKEEGE